MALTILPQNHLHVHKLGSTPNLNMLVGISSDTTWTLHNDPSMLFTLNGANAPEIHGAGIQNVPVKLTNAVNSYDQGIYELKLRVFNFDGSEEDLLTFYLLISDTTEKVIKPASLHFEAIRNVVDAEEQRFIIASTSMNVIVTLPGFLQLVSHDLSGGGHIVTVKPVPMEETPDSSYSGNINIAFPDLSIKQLPVSYTIHAGYDESYSRPVHFTRQNDELVFYKTTPEPSFLRLKMELRTFDDTGSVFRDELIDLDVAFVDNRAKLNLGKEIESYLFSGHKYSFSSLIKGVCPPAETRITAIELKYPDFEIMNQDVLPLQYFLAGRNPLKSGSAVDSFWAEFRPQISRLISRKAVVSLSIFKPALQPIKKFSMKVNGEFIKYIAPLNQTFGQLRPYFATGMVNLTETNLEPGDEISFEYEGQSIRKTFIVSPDGKESNMIAYQTAFNTFELFEFTGALSGGVEYVSDLAEYVRNYLKQTRKISAEKEQKLTINTGWILADEIYLIDELIHSKMAFLAVPNNTGLFEINSIYDSENDYHIEMIPQTSKITNFDSDTNQYQVDVEFLINPKHEDEIYSR